LNPGNFKKVKLIPDGACDFTRAMGTLCTWTTKTRGFGERSWRYSMVINDMVIEKLFLETGEVPALDYVEDPMEVSHVENMLDYLNSK
jgi:peroxiredoxin